MDNISRHILSVSLSPYLYTSLFAIPTTCSNDWTFFRLSHWESKLLNGLKPTFCLFAINLFLVQKLNVNVCRIKRELLCRTNFSDLNKIIWRHIFINLGNIAFFSYFSFLLLTDRVLVTRELIIYTYINKGKNAKLH